MSTSTPRIQLTKPVGGDAMSLGATQLSDAYNKIDAAVGVKKAATTGGVTSPFNGYLLKETSTNQSKVYTGTAWENFYDPNDGKGNVQQLDYPSSVVAQIAETFITSWGFNVEAGRKYKVNVSLAISAVNPDTGSPLVLSGYFRNNFKWAPVVDGDAGPPPTLIHDVASYYDKSTAAASKNLRVFFEFFPNVTQRVILSHYAQVLSGDLNIKFNLSGATSNFYVLDWGV